MSGPTLDVPYAVLAAAKKEWDQAADTLDGAWRRLHKASTADFSPEVAAAVEAFRETWVDHVKASATRAQAYSDEILLFGGFCVIADQEQAERLRALLPWTYRTAAIEG